MKNEVKETNGLENFGLDEDTPDLFENNSSEETHKETSVLENENSDEEEFEIPAFLRRQKN